MSEEKKIELPKIVFLLRTIGEKFCCSESFPSSSKKDCIILLNPKSPASAGKRTLNGACSPPAMRGDPIVIIPNIPLRKKMVPPHNLLVSLSIRKIETINKIQNMWRLIEFSRI